MGIPLWFDAKELMERQRLYSQKLAQKNLDLAITTSWENIYYLAGILTMQTRSHVVDPMPLVLGPKMNEPVFVPTSAFGTSVKTEYPYVSQCRPYSDKNPWRTVSDAIRGAGGERGKIGIEHRGLVVQHYEILRKLLPEAQLVDCTGLLAELRLVKSPKELEYYRMACRIIDHVIAERVGEMLKPGKTEMDVAGEITRAVIEEGAEGTSFHPQVVSGYRSALLNISSSERRLEEGDVVILDIGANYRGYRSDIARPFIIRSRPTADQRHAADAALGMTLAALNEVKPGTSAAAIHRAAHTKAREYGYDEPLRHASGHGIGLSVWEPPSCTEGEGTTIKEGMTLAIEQGVYLPAYGFRFEQNLIVTRNGFEPLFRSAMALVEV